MARKISVNFNDNHDFRMFFIKIKTKNCNFYYQKNNKIKHSNQIILETNNFKLIKLKYFFLLLKILRGLIFGIGD